MIFTPENARSVIQGTKTQTRRVALPGDKSETSMVLGRPIAFVKRNGRYLWRVDGRIVGYDWYSMAGIGKNSGTRGGGTATYRQPTYAIQAGRGQPAMGRFRIISIRHQRLQEITWQDAVAEGVANMNPIDAFSRLWDSLGQKGRRWNDNPFVWALTIERCFLTQTMGWQPLSVDAE